MDVHTIVMKKKHNCFLNTFQKNSELVYTMQFVTLFLMMYLEGKFDFVVIENNDIH